MASGLDRLQTAPVDLVVIGGGIQGAGMAREAALRGLSVALFEKGDFAGGTSSRTSHLIHGGIRYLEQGALRLVHEAVHERYVLSRLAPHLVRPLPFLFPVYRGDARGKWKIRAGMILYDLLAGSKRIGPHRMFTPAEALAEEPGLQSEGLVGAARFYDCRMDDARLCLTVLLSAREWGASIFNYVAVTGLIREKERVCGVRVQEVLTGANYDIYARIVVNAAGPWVDAICRMEGEAPRRIRQTKGIHLVFPSLTRSHAVVGSSEKDRRIFFVIPWKGKSLIGTTDTDFAGDLDHIRAEEEEVAWLLRETARLFPKERLGTEAVIGRYAGVRPLIYDPAGSASDVSREGRIEWTPGGMLILAGGKFTLFRSTAEKAVDAVVKKAPDLKAHPRPPSDPSLYGGEMPSLVEYLKEEAPPAREQYHLSSEGIRYLIGAYGTKFHAVLALGKQEKGLLKPLTPLGYPFLAEAVYAVRVEMAKHLSDFMRRRTALALGPYKRDSNMIIQIAEQMGQILGWNREQIQSEIDDYQREVE
ncbi:MAG: glycerol-3-phosphate dehydrogenase/oxidase [Candidatus Manganitrophus sp.]|nr:glycerol-3-phosphate dehydrogenase/oxidase [Candidatus Manganitrophus sp.]WDT70178.1 MAG: glycerol-3-phosphate dehydrogenase/oxidase [Candidatus Manganitrophus sp.]WDT78168.1 MAG: glycerol-3-phosphate dehydrogenase/oxidase [Candidatus Manganitrophus sp.]